MAIHYKRHSAQKPNDFDSISYAYDLISSAIYGKAILKAQIHFLNQIPENAEILVLGGGSGKFLHYMPKHLKQITFIDASINMLALAKANAPDVLQPKILWVHATEDWLHPSLKYDVIITYFYLDLFPPAKLNRVMKILWGSLQKGGLWLMCDFQVSQQRKHAWWQKLLVKLMYLFFKATSRIEANKLALFDPYFNHFRWKAKCSKLFFHNMIKADLYSK